MSLDKSLKTAASLARHRNVLTRKERIDMLMEDGRWQDGQNPVSLPKIAHRKVAVGGKKKDKKQEAAAGAEAEKKE